MYKVLFIDEQQDDIDTFKDYVEKTNTTESIEVISEYPLATLEEMVQHIFKLNPDAVISDFMLNEYKDEVTYNVPYNGVELVNEVLAIRKGFPCFVMTSFDDTAIKESDDVNIVYIKDILHKPEKDTGAKANFLERVEKQIQRYKTRIQEAETKLTELIQLKKEGSATLSQEQEIIDLDHFLEMAVDNRNVIPIEYKSLSNISRLEAIINKVDSLLEKVERKKDE